MKNWFSVPSAWLLYPPPSTTGSEYTNIQNLQLGNVYWSRMFLLGRIRRSLLSQHKDKNNGEGRKVKRMYWKQRKQRTLLTFPPQGNFGLLSVSSVRREKHCVSVCVHPALTQPKQFPFLPSFLCSDWISGFHSRNSPLALNSDSLAIPLLLLAVSSLHRNCLWLIRTVCRLDKDIIEANWIYRYTTSW